MRPVATILLLVLLSPFAFAAAPLVFDGYGAHSAPAEGAAVTELIAPPAKTDSAFDGERVFLVWYASDAVRFAIFDPGSPAPAFSGVLDDEFDEQHPPVVIFDGTRYLVFWTVARVHVAIVSPQGVVLRKTSIADIPSVDEAATNGHSFALIRQFTTPTHSGNVEVILLDSDFQIVRRTLVGTIIRSMGGGTNYLREPNIVGFGEGYYAAWTQVRTGRYEDLVGTRITSDGRPLDLMPSPHERDSLMGAPLETISGSSIEIFDLDLIVHRSRVLAITKREYGYQVRATAIDDRGVIEGPQHVAGKQWLPINATTIVRDDGSLALAWFEDDGIARVQPFTGLGSAPPPRRRATRH